jgi:putative ATPase
VDVANGDARAVLNALELAVETTEPEGEIGDWRSEISSQNPAHTSPISNLRSPSLHITLAVAEESIQRRAVLYDKEGDYHFDTISAFIKSLRGSDPDAAMYWMAKMVYAGEAPRFIFRRMLIFAGEDVGMADPNAIQVVNACAQAFEQVGMPEGRFPPGLAALYLATAKKSNSPLPFSTRWSRWSKEATAACPTTSRTAAATKKAFGHGEGYLYPHAYRDHWVAQQYLPTSLQGKVFYQPSDQGYEARSASRWRGAARRNWPPCCRRRGARRNADPLTRRPGARTLAAAHDLRRGRAAGRRCATACSTRRELARHSLVLDLKAGAGLLTWEAVRRTPEGGVFALARSRRDADALRQLAERLPQSSAHR